MGKLKKRRWTTEIVGVRYDYYDHRERDFFGFGEVKSTQLDTEDGDAPYRTTTQKYANRTYETRNLVTEATTTTADGNLIIKTENTYTKKNVHDGKSLFVAPSTTKMTTYEGTESLSISESYAYDGRGNVTSYTSTTPLDSYTTEIKYHALDKKNIYTCPSDVKVSTDGMTMRHTTSQVNGVGDLTQVSQIADDITATFDMERDEYGNVTKLTRPQNAIRQRFFRTYTYDNTHHTLVTSVTDAFGYSSSTEYDLKWCAPTKLTDINGGEMRYTYDNRGRLTSVSAPYEIEADGQATISIEYDDKNHIAKTTNYDAKTQNTIITYLFTDNLGRAIQTKNNDYVDGKGFSERDGSLKSAMLKAAKEGNKSAGLKDNFQQGDSYEQYQYFYHPDHLGSSSFITNTEGEVVQHIEYVPYGEVFIEERNNVWNTPYLFNAKEFDEETGLYYYGARYYDSRLAMWYGVDALTEKYPNMGGYVYCAGNPVRFVDVDGRKIVITNEDGTVLEYSVGMEYQGNDDFVKETVEYLNAMSKVKAGYEVLSYVSDSEKRFNFVNAPSKAGSNSFQFVKYKSGNGGIIRASAFVVSNMSEANKVEGVAHELFHAYQFINGRNIASANAEVEAYLFGNGVAANSKFGSYLYPYIIGNQTYVGDSYGYSMLNLTLFDIRTQGLEKFYGEFNNAVQSFEKGNISSYTGKYKSLVDKNYKPLIQKFLPLR